jgi:hypothetical protein
MRRLWNQVGMGPSKLSRGPAQGNAKCSCSGPSGNPGGGRNGASIHVQRSR